MPETETNGVADVMAEAAEARDREELLRMEAGERFDKYLLAGAGGGIYFATTLFKYVMHNGFCASLFFFLGIILLLLAVAAIFENATLLYVAYTLRRDQIDTLTGQVGSAGRPANIPSTDETPQKLSAIGRRIEIFNRASRWCLYLGVVSLFLSAIIISHMFRSQQMDQKPNPSSSVVHSPLAANELRESASPDGASHSQLVAKIKANTAKQAAHAKSGAGGTDGRRPGETTTR